MATHNTADNVKLTAALAFAARGWAVFPVKGKKPLTPHGYKDGTKDSAQIIQWWTQWPDANVGVVTGMSSGIGVLDVDNKNDKNGDESLRRLIEEYGPLPETLMSRTVSGGWHFVFRLPAASVRSKKGFREGLDFLAEGSYFVAPPSTIGEKSYEWTMQSEIADCPAWLAAFGQEIVEEDGDDESPEERVKRLVLDLFPKGKRSNTYWMTICPYHDDTEASLSITLKTGLFRCFACSAKGSLVDLFTKVKGISTEEAQDIINPVPWYVPELNKQLAILPVGNKIEILREIYDACGNYVSVSLFNQESLDLWYRDQQVKKRKRDVTIFQMWLEHPRRRKYDQLVFEPGLLTPPNVYNMWKGFAVQPRQGDCSLYLEHVYEVWCNGNQRYYDYTIAWFADIIQQPRHKKGVSLVLLGEQGTGKSLPCDAFGQLFGPHFVTVSQSHGLLGKFNAHLKEALVVLAEESFWAGDKEAEGQLKQLITGSKIRVEPKGKDSFEVNNHLRLIICSNQRWVIPAAFEERRFFLLEVSNCRRGQAAYFAQFAKVMNEGGREALLYFLMHHDYSQIDLRKAPHTAALQENKEATMTVVERFVLGGLDRGRWCSAHSEWVTLVSCEELHDLYIQYAMRLGQSRRSYETELGKALKKLIPGCRKRQVSTPDGRVNAWEFPALDSCRKQFDEVMNWSDHEWSAPEVRPPLELSVEQEKLLLGNGVLC